MEMGEEYSVVAVGTVYTRDTLVGVWRALCSWKLEERVCCIVNVENTWHEENSHIRAFSFHKGRSKGQW